MNSVCRFWFVVGISAVALSLNGCGQSKTDGAGGVDTASSVAASEAASSVTPVSQPTSKLAAIFTRDVIGENVAFLEKTTGPAFSTIDGGGGERSEKVSTYKVDGCEVTVGSTSGSIDNVGIGNYSQKCSFKIGQYFAATNSNSGPGSLPSYVSFSEIVHGIGGTFFAPCMSICGNAAEPSVYLVYDGAHVDNFNQILASADLIGDSSASDAWGKALAKKYGEDYLIETDMKKDNLNDLATRLYKGFHPTSVQIGTKLFGPDGPL